MSTPTDSKPNVRGRYAKTIKPSSVIHEDRMSDSDANKSFLAMARDVGADDDAKREELQNVLAIALSKGTSAVRKYDDVVLDCSFGQCTAGNLVVHLPNHVENIVRVWCRSQQGFADRTYDLVNANDWLRHEIAMNTDVSYDVASVSFDYADAITYRLNPTERQVISFNVERKATRVPTDTAETSSIATTGQANSSSNKRPLPPAQSKTREVPSLYGR